MPNKEPKISILIPTYKRRHLLPEAIDSVLNNGVDDFEIVVSDDDSDREVEEIVRKYNKSAAQKISYYAHENTTVYENWSFGASKCMGEYVFKLDDDDLILPGFLKETTDFLDKNRNVGIVFTGYRTTRDRKEFISYIDNNFFYDREVVSGTEYAFAILENKNFPRNHKSIGVFRRKFVEKIDYFNVMRTDVMFTLGMASLSDVGYIPKVYFEYRYLEQKKVGMSYHDFRETLYSLEKLFEYPWVKSKLDWMRREVEAKKKFYYFTPIIYIKDHIINKGLIETYRCTLKIITNYPKIRKSVPFWISIFPIFFIPKKIYYWLWVNIYDKYSWPAKLLNFISSRGK